MTAPDYTPQTALDRAAVRFAIEPADANHPEDVALVKSLTPVRVIAEIMRVALSDPAAIIDDRGRVKDLTAMPEPVRRSIASVKVTELYEGTGQDRELVGFTKEVKFWSKPDALGTLARSLSLLVDRTKLEVGDDVADLLREIRNAREREGRLTQPRATVTAQLPALQPGDTDV